MAVTYKTLSEILSGVCNAIRAKTGSTDTINAQNIPDAITNLPAGSALQATLLWEDDATSKGAINILSTDVGHTLGSFDYWAFAMYDSVRKFTQILFIKVENITNGTPCFVLGCDGQSTAQWQYGRNFLYDEYTSGDGLSISTAYQQWDTNDTPTEYPEKSVPMKMWGLTGTIPDIDS